MKTKKMTENFSIKIWASFATLFGAVSVLSSFVLSHVGTEDSFKAYLICLGTYGWLLAFAATHFHKQSTNKTQAVAEKLSHEAELFFVSASKIAQASANLSDAAIEQAAAIQETAASIDQVSAMVKKSSENASQSMKASQSSRLAAEGGQKAVEETIRAITDISTSNASIMSQVEDGNRQISEIVKVIAEIGNKTKVINDIVFQTKLLSFNASVEAARAGEHGKGFAVVAEEVGNLAEMSGNAAKEISGMLETSIQKVEAIVTNSKSRIEKLVVENKEKVSTGVRVAGSCGEALGRILTTVQEVDVMVTEISAASSEQAQGVSEINKAINKLDQLTHKNTATSQETAEDSKQLNQEAQNLKAGIDELTAGAARSVTPNVTAAPSPSVQSSNLPHNVIPIKPTAKAGAKSPTATQPKVLKASNADTKKEQASTLLPSKDDPRFMDV